MTDIQTVYLIDGTSLCYRSFFAIKLSTKSGFPTGAIYGFFQTLKKIKSKFSPNYIGVCFDVSRKTFRQEKFKDYKINRPAIPDNLKIQFPIIRKLVSAFGINLLEKEGFEADDIIAQFTKKAVNDNIFIVIISSDKDIYQLLENKRVGIYNPVQERLYYEDDFFKEFGFSPSSMVDYLSLTGDSIDNIPGARGIGKQTALKLIREFKTIDNIFNNLDKLSVRLRDLLVKEKENIFLSRELVKLHPIDLEVSWEDLKIKEPQYSVIYNIFSELEFRSLLKDIQPPNLNLKINVKEEPLKDFDKSLYYIMWNDKEFTYIFSLGDCVYKLKHCQSLSFLKDNTIKKISYDFKTQMHNLSTQIAGSYFDVMIASYLVSPSLTDYSLQTLCLYYLNIFTKDISSIEACYFIEKLYKVLIVKLKEKNLENLFFNIEMPLITILWEMEINGVKVEITAMLNLLSELDIKLKDLESEIFKISKKEFNINSPLQLQKILFEDLKIRPIQKTKTGYSTSEEVLEKLSKNYPIARLLLEYRQINKLKTTYVVPLIEILNKGDGKLHTTFNQTATETGRLSSSSPNLQSIPVKGKFSSLLRKAFISSFEDGYILCADYSQIELRLLAHLSSDENLKEAFIKDLDIHRYTAALLFSIKEEDVSLEQRAIAKTVNFGIIYGMSPYGLSNELGVSLQEAENFIQEYFLRYPKVKDYIQKVYKEAELTGYVVTIFGRRRDIPDINSSNPQLKEFARRQAINTPIQGSCADLIKIAMIKISNELKEKKLKTKLIIQIHDELIFDTPKQELQDAIEIVKGNMEKAIELTIPIKVNIRYGKSWQM